MNPATLFSCEQDQLWTFSQNFRPTPRWWTQKKRLVVTRRIFASICSCVLSLPQNPKTSKSVTLISLLLNIFFNFYVILYKEKTKIWNLGRDLSFLLRFLVGVSFRAQLFKEYLSIFWCCMYLGIISIILTKGWQRSTFVTKIRMQKLLVILRLYWNPIHWYSFERYWDKLSGRTNIFEILPLLGELYHFLKFSQNTFSL
jgi:hypothetical protein